MGILNSTVNGVFGLVVSIARDTNVKEHIFRTSDNMLWRFDVGSNEFVADIPSSSASEWSQQVASMLGVAVGNTLEYASVAHDDVSFRFDTV